MNFVLVVAVLVVLTLQTIIVHGSSSLVNDEAWEQYRHAMKRILSQTKEPGHLSLVFEPYDKSKFISLLQSVTYGEKDGIFQIVNSNQGMCERYGSKLMSLKSPSAFLQFKRSQCELKQTYSRTIGVGSFTIEGSSLVNGNGESVHQRQSFISSTLGNEVQINAFNPRGDLENCKPNTMTDHDFYNVLGETIKRNIGSLYTGDDDITGDDEITGDQDSNDDLLLNNDDEGMGGAINAMMLRKREENIRRITPCIQDKFRSILSDASSSSLKEFQLKVNINKIEIAHVKNNAIDTRLARSVGYGLIPRTILIAHQPSMTISLSRDDFGRIKKEFDEHRALVIGGMKFDRLKILRQQDDDDEGMGLAINNMIRRRREEWARRRVGCVQPCLNGYTSSQEPSIARKEFELATCACKCVKTLVSETVTRHIDDVRHECEASSSTFQVELGSSSSEVVGVLSDM